MIKKIRISNFKSFKDLEIGLGNFNVLIGANASGKSNFIQIFKFLKDIAKFGLDNALSEQGGIEYLRNINIGSSKNFSLEVVSNREYRRAVEKGKKLIGIETYEAIYKFAIKFRKKGKGFEIAEDKLTEKCNLVGLKKTRKGEIEEKEKLGSGEIITSNINGRVKVEPNLPKELSIYDDDLLPHFIIDEDDLSPLFIREKRLKPKTLLLKTPLVFLSNIFNYISIYDFDPKLPKRATTIIGKAELEEDGRNLAIVLKNIIENKEKERKLRNLVKDILPFVDTLDVEKFADKSLLFTLQESYTKKQALPASLISDGTINITALIIALYFETKLLTIIEEPERNIHPYLISKVTDMMKEASQRKQIIVTTHNPEIVKYAGIENILLISRNNDGFSTISRPYEKEEVRIFLQNEIGIEDLYAQNLLGA